MARMMWMWVILCAVGAIVGGCGKDEPVATPSGGLTVETVKVIEGLDLPECFVIDPADGKLYVSNVVTDNEAYWVDDSNGFISQLSPEGDILKLRWLESTAEVPIHDPKGMVILDGVLYFNDNALLKHVSLAAPDKVGVITLPGAAQLNDLATDGTHIWATDTKTGNVFCVDPNGSSRLVKGPEAINGITCYKGKVFAVSWGLHDLYELDPTGQKEPVAFGLASYFESLDGIEVLDDGTFLVSDYPGGKLCSVSADRKTVTTLMKMESPADFYLDRDKMLLYVPEMLADRATILKLNR